MNLYELSLNQVNEKTKSNNEALNHEKILFISLIKKF